MHGASAMQAAPEGMCARAARAEDRKRSPNSRRDPGRGDDICRTAAQGRGGLESPVPISDSNPLQLRPLHHITTAQGRCGCHSSASKLMSKTLGAGSEAIGFSAMPHLRRPNQSWKLSRKVSVPQFEAWWLQRKVCRSALYPALTSLRCRHWEAQHQHHGCSGTGPDPRIVYLENIER